MRLATLVEIRIGIVLALVVPAIFLMPATTNAATYYVSPNGDDTRTPAEAQDSGTPWQTIQHAVDQASTGDTIRVMDDDNAGTDDYEENIDVGSGKDDLTIERDNDTGANPQVKAKNSSTHVFEVSADDVTIRGLDIYGTTGYSNAGIYLGNSATHCIIEYNRCGWDSSHKNFYGIYLENLSENALSFNTCNSNEDSGIFLSDSSNNMLSLNTCNSNTYDGINFGGSDDNIVFLNICNLNGDGGIFLYDSDGNEIVGSLFSNSTDEGIELVSSSGNNIWGNTCNSNSLGIYVDSSSNNRLSDNTCNSNTADGIILDKGSNDNTVSGNTCSLNGDGGIFLYRSDGNTIAGNTFSNNTNEGIELYSYGGEDNDNSIFYLNTLSNNATNVKVDGGTGNRWYSPTKLGYLYGGSANTYKSYMGNWYDDYTGVDPNGDGIGDTSYATGGGGNDDYPLMQNHDSYNHQTWWMGNLRMYRGDISRPGGTVTMPWGNAVIWTAKQATLMDITFGAGDQTQNTTWTGQITFTEAPAVGVDYTLEIGYADDKDGTNFWHDGPEAYINGDGSTKIFTFTTNAVSFTVDEGKYLTMVINNNLGSTDYDIRVGGSWSYCSAPVSSQDYSLPVELSVFTATASDGEVSLHWHTETETNNLGFNVYRGDTKDGKYVKVNAALIKGAGTVSTPHDYIFTDEDVVKDSTYYYYIEDVDVSGKTGKSHIIEVTVGNAKTHLIPKQFALLQNYPNPFNPETWLPFQLAQDASVTISIYNARGQLIRMLYLGNQPAGVYMTKDRAAYWNGRNRSGQKVASGIYFYTLQAGDFFATRKMVIVK